MFHSLQGSLTRELAALVLPFPFYLLLALLVSPFRPLKNLPVTLVFLKTLPQKPFFRQTPSLQGLGPQPHQSSKLLPLVMGGFFASLRQVHLLQACYHPKHRPETLVWRPRKS